MHGMVPTVKCGGKKDMVVNGRTYTVQSFRNEGSTEWPYKYMGVAVLGDTGMTVRQASETSSVHARECCIDEMYWRLMRGITTDDGLQKYQDKQATPRYPSR